MTKSKEHIVTDNPYGLVFMGPSGEPEKQGEEVNTNMVVALKSGHNQTYTLNGNKGEINPGCSHEIVGTNLTQNRNESEEEIVAKSIVAENGDIILDAENGNIKLKAKNIYIETFGDDSNGSILVKANDHIVLKADEQLSLAGGKVCITSADSVAINATGMLWLMCSDIEKSSPLNLSLDIFKPDFIGNLVKSIASSCK